jgi:hypothetical protein
MSTDIIARGLAAGAGGKANWSLTRNRLVAARERAMARNPRLIAPATNSAGTYTLADGSTVTVACSTSAPGSGTYFPSAGTRTISDYDNILYTEGGYRAVAYSANVFAAGAKSVDGAWDNPAGKIDCMGRHTTETNAPAITFAMAGLGSVLDCKMRFLINGQYIDLAGHAPASGSGNQYYTLTFSNSRVRAVTVETQCRFGLQQVILVQGTNYYALNRPAGQKPRLMIVGDSFGLGPVVGAGFVSGTTNNMQADGMYQQAADWLGCEPIINAIGGTSFTNGSSSRIYYSNRWQDVLDAHSQTSIDALHIHGSVNDVYGSASVSDIQAAATSYLTAAVSAFPTLPITLSGCYQLTGSANAKAIQVESAYAAAVAAVVTSTGSTRIKFIPVQTPAYVPVWPGSGASSLICYDGVHFQPGAGGGHDSCGKRIASDIYRSWVAMS